MHSRSAFGKFGNLLNRSGPLVTAVIPTRNRPELVVRAVESALAQGYSNLEVVVVVDGYDAKTETALSRIRDQRLRAIALAENVGASEARNAGVRAARGEFIALLDDDDEWMPAKLTRQIALASRSKCRYPIISSRIVCRTPAADYIWPRRTPARGEPISEYLLRRRSLFQGEGLMATPTLLARREMLVKIPFRNLQKHQDWDWLLRATMLPGAGVEFCDEPLAICRMDELRPGISNTHDWRFSLSWAHSMRELMTARAYAGFLLTVVAAQASRVSSPGEYFGILKDAIRYGSPSALDVALFFGMLTIPRETRHRLRAMLERHAA
jgi:glycosyltransferase involved in cell wall biosynthesis